MGFLRRKLILIGDSTSDFAAAANWGIPAQSEYARDTLVKTDKANADPDYWEDDLWSAVEFFLAIECFT